MSCWGMTFHFTSISTQSSSGILAGPPSRSTSQISDHRCSIGDRSGDLACKVTMEHGKLKRKLEHRKQNVAAHCLIETSRREAPKERKKNRLEASVIKRWLVSEPLLHTRNERESNPILSHIMRPGAAPVWQCTLKQVSSISPKCLQI